jgi:hypothetical protein
MSAPTGGQVRALPFTGLASAPLVVIGLVLTGVGFLMTLLRPRKHAV